MSLSSRLAKLERTIGSSPVPTWAIVSGTPTDPVHLEQFRERVKQMLPPSVVTIAWCGDNPRDPTGPHINLGGQVLPLPAPSQVAAEVDTP